MSEQQSCRVLSAIAHLSALFTSLLVSIIVPIVILCASNDDVTRANAKESINFQISMIAYALVGAVLCLVFVGVFVLIAVGIASIIMPIIAAIHCAGDDEEPYRYRFIFRIV